MSSTTTSDVTYPIHNKKRGLMQRGALFRFSLAFLLISSTALGEQTFPIGGEFQVNTYTDRGQYFPAVASDPEGNFVVVWQSFGSSGTDSSNFSIQGQRYDSDGSPIGGEFQVNTYTSNRQEFASVAVDGAGAFVVVWASSGSDGTDSAGSSIQGRRYSSDGMAIGGEFQVNTYTTSFQTAPAVATDPVGRFVVVWGSLGSSGTDFSVSSVQGQRYDSDGAAIG
ncbi:MAG: hypothetical protein WBQ30_13290, partial [Thermoanaerobaculia bacterium]